MKRAMLAAAGCMCLAACAYGASRGSFDPPGLQTVILGANVFDFDRDRETIEFAGALPSTEAVAVRPLDGDARCSRVSARFAYGPSRELEIDGGEHLERGRSYWIDLPGIERNVTGLELVCRPSGVGAVTMEVLARR